MGFRSAKVPIGGDKGTQTASRSEVSIKLHRPISLKLYSNGMVSGLKLAPGRPMRGHVKLAFV